MDHLCLQNSRYVTLVPASRHPCKKIIGAGLIRQNYSPSPYPACLGQPQPLRIDVSSHRETELPAPNRRFGAHTALRFQFVGLAASWRQCQQDAKLQVLDRPYLE